jgi:hypothetical protein
VPQLPARISRRNAERATRRKKLSMSYVSLRPYVLTDSDGSDPRVAIPVSTPGAFVLVESRVRGLYTVKKSDRSGVQIAIGVAKDYVRAHHVELGRLYEQIEATRLPS